MATSNQQAAVSLMGNLYFCQQNGMTEKFNVEFLPEAVEFMGSLDQKTQQKIYYNIKKAQYTNDPELFKKLNENIWEFRTLYNKTHCRIFAFWDKSLGQQTLVLATHGIIKKKAKTPTTDIDKAERIREQYFKQKK
jgi:phage-related protein